MANIDYVGNASKNPVSTTTSQHPTLEEYERLFGVDEDAYEQPTTTRKELWSYYLYYNGKKITHRHKLKIMLTALVLQVTMAWVRDHTAKPCKYSGK